MPVNNGGAAFPGCVSADNEGGLNHGAPGMSLRDWFAGQAPLSPLWSFSPKMPTQRPEPILEGKDWPANMKELQEWDDEQKRQMSVQWPWVWADAMLKAREQ